MAVLRFAGPLPLTSRRATQSEFIRWAKTRPSVEHVVFVANTLEHLTSIRADNLLALVDAMKQSNYNVTFAGFSDSAFETLARTGIADTIGLERFYPSETLAIADLYTQAHRDDPLESCPLRGLLPRFVELSLHQDGSLRDAHRHALALCDSIVAFRFDGALNFATVAYFEDQLRAILKRRPRARHILFAAHTLTALETVAAQQLPRIFAKLREEGYWIAVSGLRDLEVEVLRRVQEDSGQVLADAVFATQAKAIESMHADAHRDSDEARCPLTEVVYQPE
jgi:anti-anti-sigma regulatory factor